MELKKDKTESVINFFKGVAIVLSIVTIVLPILIFTDVIPFKIDGYNEIGDAFGGLVNPLIATVGVTVTFLAFYISISGKPATAETNQ